MAADRIRLAHAGGQAPGDRAQHLVADGVAERVVDVLEAIAIEEQHREPAAVAARQRDRPREPIVQQQPVRQVGQRVVLGEVQHLQAALARHDDVAEHDHGAEDVALAIVNRRRRMLDRRFVAVAADQDVVALAGGPSGCARSPAATGSCACCPVRPSVTSNTSASGRAKASARVQPVSASASAIEIGDVALRIGGHHRVADRVQRDVGALALDEHLLLERRGARTSSRSAATRVRVSI